MVVWLSKHQPSTSCIRTKTKYTKNLSKWLEVWSIIRQYGILHLHENMHLWIKWSIMREEGSQRPYVIACVISGKTWQLGNLEKGTVIVKVRTRDLIRNVTCINFMNWKKTYVSTHTVESQYFFLLFSLQCSWLIYFYMLKLNSKSRNSPFSKKYFNFLEILYQVLYFPI